MSNSSWNKIYTPIILALVFIVGMSVGRHYLSGNGIHSSPTEDKLDRILQYIVSDYVDTVSLKIVEKAAIIEMMEQLDPHSSYIEPEEYHAFVDPLLGNFEGIGIQFRMIRDSLTVMLPLAGGPSEKAGIKAGDKIVMVDGDTIAAKAMNTDDIVKMIKGERGSIVELKVYRNRIDSLLSFDITRDVIPTFSLDAHFMINDSLAYIKISKFSATTIEEFDDAMKELLEKGMKELILDLRGNSGGYLRAAIAMSDTFLDKGNLIVYTKGKNRPEKKYFASGHGDFEEQKLMVLINENSASASEIVAGAIQDNDRGQIMGRRSFGKGLVQEQMDFHDGSAVRLTVARYYTPTGRSIQRSYKNGTEAYYADHYHRMLNNKENDSIAIPDSLIYITPKGKTVYGGGGIMPDVILPLDTSFNYYLYNRLIRSSIISEKAIDYANLWYKKLETYHTVQEFYKNFNTNSSVYMQIIKKAKELDIEPKKKEIEDSKVLVMGLFKAELARLLFGENAYYYVYLQEDKIFKKAVVLMEEEE